MPGTAQGTETYSNNAIIILITIYLLSSAPMLAGEIIHLLNSSEWKSIFKMPSLREEVNKWRTWSESGLHYYSVHCSLQFCAASYRCYIFCLEGAECALFWFNSLNTLQAIIFIFLVGKWAHRGWVTWAELHRTVAGSRAEKVRSAWLPSLLSVHLAHGMIQSEGKSL